jgi:hypothetical protein
MQRAIGDWHGKSRLCENLSHFERHIESVQTGENIHCPVGCVVSRVIQSVWIV